MVFDIASFASGFVFGFAFGWMILGAIAEVLR